KLQAQIKQLGSTQARVYFEQDRWYHIALTWEISDAGEAQAHFYINGCEAPYPHYREPFPANNKGLAAPGRRASIGVVDAYGRRFQSGWIDEFRLSRTVRYRQTFAPPKTPMAADSDTVILDHFDVLPTIKSGK